jgi:hypothetical protein
MELHHNTFSFDTPKGNENTAVKLDMTAYTDELWMQGIYPYFEQWMNLGTRIENEGRVVYEFTLPNAYANVLESAIKKAVESMQGQKN